MEEQKEKGAALAVGDFVQLIAEPWHLHAGCFVLVTKVDEDGNGFDFVVPEQRGHSPATFVREIISRGVKLDEISSHD